MWSIENRFCLLACAVPLSRGPIAYLYCTVKYITMPSSSYKIFVVCVFLSSFGFLFLSFVLHLSSYLNNNKLVYFIIVVIIFHLSRVCIQSFLQQKAMLVTVVASILSSVAIPAIRQRTNRAQ